MIIWHVSFFDVWEDADVFADGHDDIEYCHDWPVGHLRLGGWLYAQQNFDINFSSAGITR